MILLIQVTKVSYLVFSDFSLWKNPSQSQSSQWLYEKVTEVSDFHIWLRSLIRIIFEHYHQWKLLELFLYSQLINTIRCLNLLQFYLKFLIYIECHDHNQTVFTLFIQSAGRVEYWSSTILYILHVVLSLSFWLGV